MKKIYTIFLLLAISSTVAFAQSSKTKKADKLYDQLKYTDAAEEYLSLVKNGDNSNYVHERLANSYYFVNDTKNAETYYQRVVKDKNVDPETVFNYAQTLKSNGKPKEFNEQMKRFAQMKPNDSRAVEFMKDPNYLPRIIEESKQKYTASNLNELNSKFSDFGGRIYNGTFYFTSARNTARKTYEWNDEPFLDIYKASIVGGVIKDAELLKGDVNTKYHESTVAISPDGKRMYFDRNDYYKGKYKKDKDGINQLNIYYATNVDGRWTDIQPVSFNDTEYSNSHPAISADGKTLYFTSDRPGGKGQSDIYKVAIKADGSFGTPENVTDVNTEGREGFPFVDANGTLYFSSDGHMGMGGLDVFAAKAKGNGFEKPVNMGHGVNSLKDDFAFFYDVKTEEGFVSSDRAGGKGSDDIYRIEKIKSCELIANVTVIDIQTKEKLSNVRLELFDNKENRLKTQTSDNQGKGRFALACDQGHVIQASKEGYESGAQTIASVSKSEEKEITIALRPIDLIAEEGKVKLNAIHFDFDKHNIRPQAAFELDKLVEYMKKNKDVVIKVEAHTDNRGSAAYNKALSNRRAKSTVEYVISKGISKDRISGEGFGKSRPLHDCGDNCTEQQHEDNRRSEFIIVKK